MAYPSNISSAQIGRYELGRTGADIIIEETFNKAWGLNYRQNDLIATLMTIERAGRFGSVARSKDPKWAIGDYSKERTTLMAVLLYNATQAVLAEGHFQSGDTIHLNDLISSTQEVIQFKIDGLVGGNETVGFTYSITVIFTTLSSGQFTTDAQGHVLAPIADYDGQARTPITAYGNALTNNVQRIREGVFKGKVEQSDAAWIADNSIEHLVKLAFDSYARKINKTLYASYTKRSAPSAIGNDYGRFGGIPHFLNPHGAVSGVASTDVKGINSVDSGSDLTYDNLIEWSGPLFDKTGDVKHLFANRTMVNKVMKMMRNEIALERPSYNSVDIGMPNVYQIPTFSLGYGTFQLHYDITLNELDTKVTSSSSGSELTSKPSHSMLALDLNDIGIIPFVVDGEGAKMPAIRPVDPIRNESRDEYEFDSIITMGLGDPEKHGYYGLSGA